MQLLDPPLKLTCHGCGAQQDYSATDQALRCSYCASVTEIARTAQSPAPPAASEEAIVPLSVSEQALLDAVYQHLASGALTPDDLLACAAFTRKDRFYAPTFEFSGSYEAKWTASFGYDRVEHYTVYENRTENGRAKQVPVTKTRTVTDWRPASGSDAGRFQVRTYAGERLGAADSPLLALVEDEGLGHPVVFNPSYALGIQKEAFAREADAAYEQRGRSQVHLCIDAGVERHGQGDRQSDWHWTAQIRKQHRTVWVPVCHVTYDYQGQPYQVWTSGVDTEHMVADTLPVDRSRVKALAWGLAPLAIALLASPMALRTAKQMEEEPILPVLTLVAAAAFAVWRYMAIVGQSMQRRQAFLAARRGHPSGVSGAGAKPTAAARIVGAAAHRTVLICACIGAGLLPALSVVQWPSWRLAAPVAEDAPPPRLDPRAAPRPSPQPVITPAPARPAPAVPLTAEQAIISVLQAASSKDWQAVDERLARMKSSAPPSSPGDIEALNDKARRWLRQDDTTRAEQALTQVVAIAPDRPSGWATLTEVLTNADAGLSALRVAVHLSTDREKTLVYLRDAAQNSASENFAKLAAAVLKEIDQIPRHAKDTSGKPL